MRQLTYISYRINNWIVLYYSTLFFLFMVDTVYILAITYVSGKFVDQGRGIV